MSVHLIATWLCSPQACYNIKNKKREKKENKSFYCVDLRIRLISSIFLFKTVILYHYQDKW